MRRSLANVKGSSGTTRGAVGRGRGDGRLGATGRRVAERPHPPTHREPNDARAVSGHRLSMGISKEARRCPIRTPEVGAVNGRSAAGREPFAAGPAYAPSTSSRRRDGATAPHRRAGRNARRRNRRRTRGWAATGRRVCFLAPHSSHFLTPHVHVYQALMWSHPRESHDRSTARA